MGPLGKRTHTFLVYIEVCVYGLVTGLGMRFIRTGRTAADIYLSMVPATASLPMKKARTGP